MEKTEVVDIVDDFKIIWRRSIERLREQKILEQNQYSLLMELKVRCKGYAMSSRNPYINYNDSVRLVLSGNEYKIYNSVFKDNNKLFEKLIHEFWFQLGNKLIYTINICIEDIDY